MLNLLLRLLFALALLSFSVSAVAKLSVFACEPEWAALSKELAGENARVFAATHAGQDPHHIQARPSLIAKLRSADLAVCSGAELETGWMPMLQRRARNPRVMSGQPGYFAAASQVALMEIPTKLDRADGDVHSEGNPHIQLDARRMLTVAKALSARLQSLDPGNRPDYEKRLRTYTQRWQAAIDRWQKKAAGLQGKKVIVHHREWIYLLDWLGMERVGSLEPKSGIPPTLAHLSKLKQQPLDLIIISPLNDSKASSWLRQQTGVPVVVLPHTVGAVPNSDDLFSLFDEIIRRLVDEGMH
jgi:zinc/manganese transport system substrate-binding protein